MAHTVRGREAMERIAGRLNAFVLKDTQKMLRHNPSIEHTARAHEKRKAFFAYFAKNGFDSAQVMKLLAGPGKLERIVRRIAHLPKGALRRLRALMGKA